MLVRRSPNSTVYISHPFGYTAHAPTSEGKLRPVTRDRYERIIERFLQADLFDHLWISREQDEYGGLIASVEADYIKLTVSFQLPKDSDRLAAFREAMAARGYELLDENRGINGVGPDMLSLMLKYRFDKDLASVKAVVDHALETLQGPEGEEIFVYLYRSEDSPHLGFGIKVVPMQDLLAKVP